jgi:membrane protein insertase Oxa1/YidC/SpoIIIJ
MYDLSKYGSQLQDFMKEKNIKPIANIVPILAQVTILFYNYT